MNHLKLMLAVILFWMTSITGLFAQNSFNKSTDFLLANYDIKPDEDDVMAATAFGCMLIHQDLSGLNYLAVAGAYGTQGCSFITAALPLYANLFGPEGVNWTNAHNNWNASVHLAKDKVKSALNGGGRVFIQEAGQSDFTHDVLQQAINEGISYAIIKQNVIVVQHSTWNENNSTQFKLNWVKNNTDYRKIPDGNAGGNGTPGYNDGNSTWLNQAKSSNNPNATARAYWQQADDIIDAWHSCYNNGTIESGGVDFSDNVEMWYIFDIGGSADNISKFWQRYVINTTGPIDDIASTSVPSVVSQGSQVDVGVDYSSSTNRDIIVYFQLANSPYTVYSEVKLDVVAGDNQSASIAVNIPSDVPIGTDQYQFNVIITSDNGDYSHRLDELPKVDIDVLPGGSGEQSSFTYHQIPGTIQAEHYDIGGEGVAFHDLDVSNNGEAFRPGESVDVEATTDSGGGYNVGWLADGEWLEYTIDTIVNGNYDLVFRVASDNTGAKSLVVKMDQQELGTLQIPYTGGWQVWQDLILQNVPLAEGNDQVLRLEITGGNFNINFVSFLEAPQHVPVTGLTLDPESVTLSVIGQTQSINAMVNPENASNQKIQWMSDEPGIVSVNSSGVITAQAEGQALIIGTAEDGGFSDTTTVVVSLSTSQTPYPSGVSHPVPGLIESEHYDTGGQGESYFDSDPANVGGYGRTEEAVDLGGSVSEGGTVVGWTAPGEWLEYTVDVASDGNYELAIRHAGLNATGMLNVEFAGGNNITANLSPTGGWDSYTTSYFTIALSAGTQVMRVLVEQAGVNLNWLSLTLVNNNQMVLSPVNDAYLQGGTLFNTNDLRTEDGNRIAYLMFDLSGIGGQITSANLEFSVSSDAGNGSISVFEGAHSNWSQQNLSTSNAPPAGTLLANMNTSYDLGQSYNWSFLEGSIEGGSMLSLVIVHSEGNDVSFGASENQNQSLRPKLTLNVSNAARNSYDALANVGILKPVLIYPNPITSYFKVRGLEAGSHVINIHGLDGRLLKRLVVETEENVDLKIESDYLESGIYLIKVNDALYRIIKQE